jgi:hypothetical protein
MDFDSFRDSFLDNKYSSWYFAIMKNAASRGWTKASAPCYVEMHHAIPKSMGGTGRDIVCLTAREHFICHLLLPKMLEGKDKVKMTFALHRLITGNKKNYCKSSIHYQIIKEANSKASSVRNAEYWSQFTEEERSDMRSGEKNGRYGKEVRDSTRQKISQANKGRLVGNKHPLWGVGHTEESKKKMSLSQKGKRVGSKNPMYGKVGKSAGKKWYNNGIEELYFIPNTQPQDWVTGRLKRKA